MDKNKIYMMDATPYRHQSVTHQIVNRKSKNRKLLDLDFTQPSVTDEELLAALTIRIEEMLVNDKDMLLSLLYRLDVEEKPILEALHPGAADSPALGLARLVLARQKQRAASKRDVEVKPSGIPEGWEW